MRAEATFSEEELEYLQGERRLGKLATVDAAGQPHVVPVGWGYNPELGTIDVGGHNLAASKKFRNVRANPKVAFVVDDLASVKPWRPRCDDPGPRRGRGGLRWPAAADPHHAGEGLLLGPRPASSGLDFSSRRGAR